LRMAGDWCVRKRVFNVAGALRKAYPHAVESLCLFDSLELRKPLWSSGKIAGLLT